MTTASGSALLQSMIAAARAGGRVLLDHFGRLASLDVSEKGPSDFVSQADLLSEAAIKEALSTANPGALFEAEESVSGRAREGARFVIDPLDGTTNFLRGIPHFAISIAYADGAELVAGVILDPTRDELFSAERGRGAFLASTDDRALHASQRSELRECVIHTGVPHRGRGDHPQYRGELARVMAEVAGIRRMGAAALDLAYVAAGRGDGFFERDLQAWDLAAGILLVREAGGIVTDFDGGDEMLARGDVIAAAPSIHPLLHAALHGDGG